MQSFKCIFLIATVLSSNTIASEPLAENAKSWFIAQYEESKEFEFHHGFYAEVEEFFPIYESVNDIENQIRLLGDQAPSNLHQRFEAAKAGGQSHVYRIWYERDDLWRTTRDDFPANPDSPYGDSARRGDVLWYMTKNTLHTTDVQALKEQGRWIDPNSQRISIMFNLFRALFAVSPPPITYTVSNADPADNSPYEVVISTLHSNTNVDHARFYLNRVDNGFEIREMRIDRNDQESSEFVGSKTTYSDWSYDSVFQRPIARERTLYNGERARTVYRVRELRVINEHDELDELAALPSINGVDRIRGPVSFTSLMNHSQNEELLLSRAPNTEPASDTPTDIIRRNRIRSEEDAGILDRLGLLTLVGLGVLLFGMYIRKRNST